MLAQGTVKSELQIMGCSVNGKPLLKAHSGKVGYVSSSLAQSIKKESSISNVNFLEWFETLITEWCTWGTVAFVLRLLGIKYGLHLADPSRK